ncbi:uridine phosphorylase [Acidithiobacillus ferrivorans]|uniref:Uridine phosphorylase n=1 Tax=Acidithiobacillus ferrivorans TaxID=160808 RepID=A0A1B9BZY2_9PROT|nr:uridine phosphorylase [Acidithiobacillus ferrivorans]MBN6739828.1 uridine phosphorylase [Acidithiobacillus sp. MC6.1]OCB03285.1 uridine phosphorylase [Acidithiobacillus ferrivorans]QQD72204.1 uridine phosphorylase [Acidithiobacillus ferrivorans]
MTGVVCDSTAVQYHIGLSRAMLRGARYVLLPGDPDRVEPIARCLDRAIELARHREYRSALGYVDDTPVLVMSTGIGSPSTGIAVEELARLGVTHFLRLGTTGAIQPHIALGDLIISEGAVRLEGTSGHYAPVEYPAVASLSLTQKLVEAAVHHNFSYQTGICCSSDSFWPGQERYDSFSGYVQRRFQGSLDEWQQLGVLNFEMETSALFTIVRTFGLHAASLCGVIALRTQSESVQEGVYAQVKERLALVARETVKRHAAADAR